MTKNTHRSTPIERRSPQVALSVIGRALATTGPATAAAPSRPADGAGRASFLVPCLPPVPGGAAARVGHDDDGAPPDEARGAKRPRNSQ